MSTFSSHWPVLNQYEGAHLRRVALPLGGIGTGTVSLGGRGDWRDWEIVNRPAKGFVPVGHQWTLDGAAPFFALWARTSNGETVTRCLEGPLAPEDYEGAFGIEHLPNHGLPRFESNQFSVAYPLAQVSFQDPQVPVQVRLEAFNPLVPADVEASSWPVAVARWVVSNPTNEPIEAAICGMVPNFIGADGSQPYFSQLRGNRNEFRREAGVAGVFMSSIELDPNCEQFGNLFFGVVEDDRTTTSHRLDWTHGTWGAGLLDFWDDFTSDGKVEDRPHASPDPKATLCAKFSLEAGESREVTFLLAWHFPNRKTWTPRPGEPPETVGNFYTTQWTDAFETAQCFALQLADLEARTVAFVKAFVEADLPAVVKEAALNNLSTLRCQTVFRLPSGYLMGWEGCGDHGGSCFGSCTHVWNYENALGFLFGDLSRSMRKIEFLHALRPDGRMPFRVALPFERINEGGLDSAVQSGMAAADGQMGTIVRLFRDWKLYGDEQWLAQMWPGAKKALEWCWVEGGWDADCDGVMEGCQHNTMDVEYFGPNPQMGFWYLAALRASEEMARAMNDDEFANHCRDLFERGSRYLDQHLFNGDYYEQHIHSYSEDTTFAYGTRQKWDDVWGKSSLENPEYQIGAGCLIDQLIGQLTAHACSLGLLGNAQNQRASLESVRRWNWQKPLRAQFNPMRTFATGEEGALVMCSFPHGNRPEKPFPYYAEVMTGFEYTAAASMIYAGMKEEGLEVISAIRSRYDGLKRNPFDEAEAGHHYVRALASWTSILALTGFEFSALEKSIAFNKAPGNVQWFWSNGSAWGTWQQQDDGVTLQVLHGEVTLCEVRIKGEAERVFHFDQRTIQAGEQWSEKL